MTGKIDNYFIPHPEPFLFFVSHQSDNLADEEFGTSFLCKKINSNVSVTLKYGKSNLKDQCGLYEVPLLCLKKMMMEKAKIYLPWEKL